MIDFLNNLSCLEVVLQNYFYCGYFYLANFDLFSCTDKMICLVLCTSDCLVVFVCIQQCYVRIFGNSYTIFCVLCILFICVVVV